MDELMQNQKKLVYHYTSINSFIKIADELKNGHLLFHANGLHYMNDSSEFIYGFKKFCELLPSMEKEIEGLNEELKLSNVIDKWNSYMNGHWEEMFIRTLKEENRTPFVISTSSDGDSIPMWAMYGYKGQGVAIGMEIVPYYTMTKTPDGKTVYDITKYGDIKTRAFKVMPSLPLEHPAIIESKMAYKKYIAKAQQGYGDLTEMKLIAIYQMSVLSAALIKHPAFEFEKEWRILSFPQKPDDILYKTNINNDITPYIKQTISLSALKKIIIGPCNNGKYQKSIIEQLLRLKGNITNCQVVFSKIPYKG
ncbi:MAG: DUF2971 domain-containing protein [Prevotella sp.]|nr:DUF2971 domain-containing protein [Prevotella sp.]